MFFVNKGTNSLKKFSIENSICYKIKESNSKNLFDYQDEIEAKFKGTNSKITDKNVCNNILQS